MVRICFPGQGGQVSNLTEAQWESRQVGPKGHTDWTSLSPLAQTGKDLAGGWGDLSTAGGGHRLPSPSCALQMPPGCWPTLPEG